MNWQMIVVPEVCAWLRALRKADEPTLFLITAALDRLIEEGPGLGRPLVGTLQRAAIKNLKELRPGLGGRGQEEARLIFAFDPWRQRVVVVAGDKLTDWDDWYDVAIKVAQERFARHVREVVS